MVAWLLPTLVGAGMSLWGSNKQDKANKAALDQQNAATSYQQQFEQQNRERSWGQQDSRLSFLDAWLNGKDVGISPSAGNPGGNYNFSGLGALPQAQSQLADYYKFLKEAPDTTYNAQVGGQEAATNAAIRRASDVMGARGMGNSGMYSGMISNILGQNIRNRSALEGERVTRQGENIAKGTQLSQSILDKILNMQNSAYGMSTPASTQVPGMMSQTARMKAGMNGGGDALSDAGGSLASAGIYNYLYGRDKTSTPAQTSNPYIGDMAWLLRGGQ